MASRHPGDTAGLPVVTGDPENGSARGLGSSSSPCSAASRTLRQLLALALELGRGVYVAVRRGAHLIGAPQRAGDVDALEPRHAVEVLGAEQDHVLGATLALGRGAAHVGHPRATEQRALDPPRSAIRRR